MRTNKIILTSVFALSALLSNAQIIVTQTQTPTELVNDVLVGSGVVISNVKFNNSVPFANAIQTQVGYFNANSTTFPLAEGVVMATGNAILAVGPNNAGSATNNTGVAADPNDADLDAISTAPMNDEAVLEFDFVPDGDSVLFRYIFASEEYPEFSPSTYNDAFGFFISGPGFAGPYSGGGVNIAQLPSPIIPVTINNVNPTTNATYYVSNPTGATAIQYDGRTVVLTAAAQVQCGQTYHIKLAIADAGDWSWDSAVFLEASSFSSNGVQVQIASATGSSAITEACDSAIVTFIRPPDQVDVPLTITYGIGGTATNGTDYPLLPGTITFPIGIDTVQFYITPSADGLTEGIETVILTVTIVNECGDTITTTATIEIVDPVPFSVVPGNVVLDCPVPTTPITATATGGVGPFTYNWALGPNTPTINVPGNIPGVTNYNVSMTDACGSVQNGSVTVTLNPAPVPTINFNFDTQIICPNDDATFIASVINPYNAGALTYNWTPAPGGTTNTVTVSPNVLTWYYLTINDGCYNVTDSVKVDMGNVNITSVIIDDATNCPGQLGVLGQVQVFPNDPTYTYTLNGGGFVYGPQSSNTFTNLNGGVIYFLNVVNANGCSKDTTIVVGLGMNAVTATWDASALQDVTCGGMQNGAAAVTNIGGGITPPYTVTWTHTTGLFDDATVGVGGSDNITNLFGGNWVVTVTDDEGCAWSHLFSIFEPAVLTLDFISNNPTCYQFNDASVTASTTGGNGGNIFTMTNSAGTLLNSSNSNTINLLVEGWYYTTIVDSEGCTIEDSIFITQPGELGIDLNIIQPLCYGIASGYVEVDTVFNYAGTYDSLAYFWAPNPSGINGVGASFNNHMGPGSYALTITDGNGCSKVFDFTITYPDELVFTEIGSHPAYCRLYSYQSGNGVVFAAASGGTPDYSYLWTNNQTGVTTTNTTWGGRNPGSYSIHVIDDHGCTLDTTIQLDSLSPIAEFDVTSAQFLTPGVYEGTAVVNVTFTNQSLYFANPFNPTADTTFFWNLDTANAGWQITHDYSQTYDTSYALSGIYTVCLVAINKNGCKDTTCKDMIIYDPLTFVPINVFTPDGDGINDGFTFYNRSIAVATFECTIVNRWGVVVNIMDDITDVWNGTDMNGSVCTDGAYFYTYSGAAFNSETFEGQGVVEILNSKP